MASPDWCFRFTEGPPPATCEHPWLRWTIHPSPNLCEEESRTGSRFTRGPPPGYLWTPEQGGLAPVLLPTEWPLGEKRKELRRRCPAGISLVRRATR